MSYESIRFKIPGIVHGSVQVSNGSFNGSATYDHEIGFWTATLNKNTGTPNYTITYTPPTTYNVSYTPGTSTSSGTLSVVAANAAQKINDKAWEVDAAAKVYDNDTEVTFGDIRFAYGSGDSVIANYSSGAWRARVPIDPAANSDITISVNYDKYENIDKNEFEQLLANATNNTCNFKEMRFTDNMENFNDHGVRTYNFVDCIFEEPAGLFSGKTATLITFNDDETNEAEKTTPSANACQFNGSCNSMFANATIGNIKFLAINTSAVTSVIDMFNGCSISQLQLSTFNFNGILLASNVSGFIDNNTNIETIKGRTGFIFVNNSSNTINININNAQVDTGVIASAEGAIITILHDSLLINFNNESYSFDPPSVVVEKNATTAPSVSFNTITDQSTGNAVTSGSMVCGFGGQVSVFDYGVTGWTQNASASVGTFTAPLDNATATSVAVADITVSKVIVVDIEKDHVHLSDNISITSMPSGDVTTNISADENDYFILTTSNENITVTSSVVEGKLVLTFDCGSEEFQNIGVSGSCYTQANKNYIEEAITTSTSSSITFEYVYFDSLSGFANMSRDPVNDDTTYPRRVYVDTFVLDHCLIGNAEGLFSNGDSSNKVKSVTISKCTFEGNSMERMFYGCTKLESVTFEDNITAGVTNMSEMFKNCYELGTVDLSNLDASHVTDMSGMFEGSNVETVILGNRFNTSNVTDMSDMFKNASVNNINLTGLNTSSVTNMSGMFDNMRGVEEISLASFNTTNVQNMSNMFKGTTFASLDLASFDVNVVTDMSGMFSGMNKIEILDLSNFYTGSLQNADEMFKGTTQLRYLDLSNLDTSALTSAENIFQSSGIQTLVIAADANASSDNDIKLANATPIDTSLDYASVFHYKRGENNYIDVIGVNRGANTVNVKFTTVGVTTPIDYLTFGVSDYSKPIEIPFHASIHNATTSVGEIDYTNAKYITLTIDSETADSTVNAIIDLHYFSFAVSPSTIELTDSATEIIVDQLPLMTITMTASASNSKMSISKAKVAATSANANLYTRASLGLDSQKLIVISDETNEPYGSFTVDTQSVAFDTVGRSTTLKISDSETFATPIELSSFTLYIGMEPISDMTETQYGDLLTARRSTNIFVVRNRTIDTVTGTPWSEQDYSTYTAFEFIECTFTNMANLFYYPTSHTYERADHTILFKNCIIAGSCANAFKGDTAKAIFDGDVEVTHAITFNNVDTSAATSFESMFEGCPHITSLEFPDFDTTSVTNMQKMFFAAPSLKEVNMETFNTRNIAVANLADIYGNNTSLWRVKPGYDCNDTRSANYLVLKAVNGRYETPLLIHVIRGTGWYELGNSDILFNIDAGGMSVEIYENKGSSDFYTYKVSDTRFKIASNATEIPALKFKIKQYGEYVTARKFYATICEQVVEFTYNSVAEYWEKHSIVYGEFKLPQTSQTVELQNSKAVIVSVISEDNKDTTVVTKCVSSWPTTAFEVINVNDYTYSIGTKTMYAVPDNNVTVTFEVESNKLMASLSDISMSAVCNLIIDFAIYDEMTKAEFEAAIAASSGTTVSFKNKKFTDDMSSFTAASVTAFDFEHCIFEDSGDLFKNNTTVTGVTFEGCEFTGDCSSLLEGCTALTSVTFENTRSTSVTSVDNLFKGCTALTDVVFDLDTTGCSSITDLFTGATSLTSVTLSAAIDATGSDEFTHIKIATSGATPYDTGVICQTDATTPHTYLVAYAVNYTAVRPTKVRVESASPNYILRGSTSITVSVVVFEKSNNGETEDTESKPYTGDSTWVQVYGSDVDVPDGTYKLANHELVGTTTTWSGTIPVTTVTDTLELNVETDNQRSMSKSEFSEQLASGRSTFRRVTFDDNLHEYTNPEDITELTFEQCNFVDQQGAFADQDNLDKLNLNQCNYEYQNE